MPKTSTDSDGSEAFFQRFPLIQSQLSESILWVTLGSNSGTGVQPMASELFVSLGDLFDAVTTRDDIRVIALEGAGKRFAVGGDVKRMATGANDKNWLSRSSGIHAVARMYRLMSAVDQPIIASLNGDAVGAGATLALHCDMIVASDGARIGDPHVLRGLVPSVGAYVWPLHVPINIAKEYLLTGDLMSIEEAFRLGIVNHIYPKDELHRATAELAERLSKIAPNAVRWTKRLLNQSLNQRLVEGMDSGVAHEILTFKTEDHIEGAVAFVERRPPEFTGR